MYTKTIPYKNYKQQARNELLELHLDEREVFKLFPEFQRLFQWRESLMNEKGVRELSPEEVREFYNDLETVLLAAWGVMSDDGNHFRKSGRYDFEESALFNATMVMFLTEPEEANRMLDALMPAGLADMVKKANDNADVIRNNPQTDEAVRAQIELLQAKLENSENQSA